jgi:phage-related minor tail protein
MEFPKGTRSHAAIFNAYHQRYNELLGDRREEYAAQAESERQSIIAGKLVGGASIWTALQIAGGFIMLMFFFLLIAIERHQRKQAVSASVVQ